MRARSRGWALCRCFSSWTLRRGLGLRSGGRRVRDLSGPVGDRVSLLILALIFDPVRVASLGWVMTYHPEIPVHSSYPLIRILLQQLARDELLQRQHHAILTPYADCCTPILDSLHCVFDLEVAAIGGEDGVGEVVASAYRGLYETFSIRNDSRCV